MIPTMLLAGLIAGALAKPWHWVGLAVVIVAWPLILIASGTIGPSDLEGIVGALLLATVNAAVAFWVMRSAVKIVQAIRATRFPK